MSWARVQAIASAAEFSHLVGAGFNRIVVVAAHRDRTPQHVRLHRIHDETGVGAIADVIAQEDVALDTIRARMLETGRQRLPVGVDVGQERNSHGPTFREQRRVSTLP